MKKTQIARIRGVLQKANPFMILEYKSEIPETYINEVTAYYHVILRLFMAFPRGYMDLPLFLNQHMGMNINDAELLCGQKQVFYFPLYDCDYPERKEKLREVLSILLKHTGCTFNENAFASALTKFDIEMLNRKMKERVEDGSIFQFLKEYGYEE